MNKKILFISEHFRLFNGIDCGAANRSTLFVKALAQIGQVDVISFCQSPVESNIPGCTVIFQQYIPRSISKRATGIRKVTNFLHKVFQPWDPYQYYPLEEEKKNVIDKILNQGKYDYVACRYIEEAVRCGLLAYSDQLIIDVDDNLVAAAKRDLAKCHFKTGFNRWLAYKMTYTWDLMSKYVLKKVRNSFYSNISEPPYQKSTFLPNITNLQNIIPPLQGVMPQRILIVGWLDFLPNRNGVDYFAHKVFPLILEQNPDVELHIAGKCSDAAFMSELNGLPGVSALGYVEDIAMEYAECGVVAIPVYLGSGTSVKFVEALHMNRPIVSTPMGVRGFEKICVNKIHYLLGENDKSFADNVVSLLQSVSKSRNLAASAHSVGEQYFSQKQFMRIVKEEIAK